MPDGELIDRARKFLGGETLKFEEADALWKGLKDSDALSLARRVLQQIRQKTGSLSDGIPDDAVDGVPISSNTSVRT